MNTWFIAAQVLGVVTILFEFASYQIKDKPRYFLAQGLGSFFWTAMFFAVGMASGMDTMISLIVAATYSTIRNLVFWQIFARNTPRSKEFGLNFLLVMIVVALIAGFFSISNAPEQVRWLHVIGMIAALSFVIGQYMPGVHAVRITVVVYALAAMMLQTPLNILHGDFRWNIMGILIEVAKIASVAVFYLRSKEDVHAPILEFAKPQAEVRAKARAEAR